MADFERIADPNELASRAEEKNLQADLAEQRRIAAMGRHPGPDYTICVDCEDVIEPPRVQHGFARCLGCQVAHEKARRQRGR